jgi:uncharacterized membrane protein YdjX (TVP38/TMEM64 family)
MTESSNAHNLAKGKGRWWLLGGAVVVVSISAPFLPLARWLGGADRYVAGLGAWGFALFVFVYALATILFIPGSALTLGAGLIYGLGAGTLAVTLGANLGANAAFLLGRRVARGRIAKAAAADPRFHAMDSAIARQGWKVVLLMRLSPLIPFNLLNYLLGLTSIGFWAYAANSFLGMLPGTVLYVYIGAAGRAGLTRGADVSRLKIVSFVAGLVATFAVSWLLAWQARKILRESGPNPVAENSKT